MEINPVTAYTSRSGFLADFQQIDCLDFAQNLLKNVG
jgi:hypothetical protein